MAEQKSRRAVVIFFSQYLLRFDIAATEPEDTTRDLLLPNVAGPNFSKSGDGRIFDMRSFLMVLFFLLSVNLFAAENVYFSAGANIAANQCICFNSVAWYPSTSVNCSGINADTKLCEAVSTQDVTTGNTGLAVMSGVVQVTAETTVTRDAAVYLNLSTGFLTTSGTPTQEVFVGRALESTASASEYFDLWIHPTPQHYPYIDDSMLGNSVFTRYGGSIRWLRTSDVAVPAYTNPHERSRISFAVPDNVGSSTLQEDHLSALAATRI